MFLGQHHHNLDTKNRLTIPARYRELLAEGVYLLQGLDNNLMGFTTQEFAAISAQASQLSLTDPNARLLQRLIFSTADLLEVDKAGRVLIPDFLRQLAGLQNEVVLVGMGDHFEIWSPERWGEQMVLLQDSSANAARFASLNISTAVPTLR